MTDKPIKIYSPFIEEEALSQFYGAMNQDFSVQGALMPDAHVGYSLPIGAVVATKDCIVPAWVGYDQGCGVCALRTSFDAADVKLFAKDIFDQIHRDVPTGFHRNQHRVNWDWTDIPHTPFLADTFKNTDGLRQIGTLGSGNHFIEVGVGTDEHVWIIVHSGSRKVGHSMAKYYMELASYMNTGIRKAKEGHYPLWLDSSEGKEYDMDLDFCLKFALENRKEIARRVENAIAKALRCYADSDWINLINRNHNHAEYNFDLGLYIHRKGATHAEEGMFGVIPGNMRDGSYIVKGKGNPDSLFSSSHGAGRVGSRRQARETIDLDTFKNQMQGIQATVSKHTLDEAPDAYKNFQNIMDLQKDLVEIITHVHPIINIKDKGGKKRKRNR